jgi:hypothetical protein
MKLKIFRANQIAMTISVLIIILSKKGTLIYNSADYFLGITLLVLLWFVVNATSNFLELENKMKEIDKNDETSE